MRPFVLWSSILPDSKDISKLASRAEDLRRSKAVKDALKKDHDELERERQLLRELAQAEAGLQDREQRATSLAQLRNTLRRLSQKANETADSAERRLARRVLRGTSAAARERVNDPDYRKLIDELGLAPRLWGGPPGPQPAPWPAHVGLQSGPSGFSPLIPALTAGAI